MSSSTTQEPTDSTTHDTNAIFRSATEQSTCNRATICSSGLGRSVASSIRHSVSISDVVAERYTGPQDCYGSTEGVCSVGCVGQVVKRLIARMKAVLTNVIEVFAIPHYPTRSGVH